MLLFGVLMGRALLWLILPKTNLSMAPLLVQSAVTSAVQEETIVAIMISPITPATNTHCMSHKSQKGLVARNEDCRNSTKSRIPIISVAAWSRGVNLSYVINYPQRLIYKSITSHHHLQISSNACASKLLTWRSSLFVYSVGNSYINTIKEIPTQEIQYM